MKSLGLALGGGGLKGLAHIGVLQVLKENHIPVSFISGTSAGSVIAALFASGISPYTMEKLALNLNAGDYIDYNIGGILKYIVSLYIPQIKAPLNGFIKGDKIEELIYKWTAGKKLKDVNIPLAIIACDIDSGQEIIFTNQNLKPDKTTIVVKDALLSEAVRASISIPVTFVPRKLAGMQLVDGGVRDMVPVIVQKKMGAEYILAVNLGQEIYTQSVEGIEQIIRRTLSILTYETSDEAEEILADMIVFPGIKGVKLDESYKAPEIIRQGRRAMKRKVDELIKGLWLA